MNLVNAVDSAKEHLRQYVREQRMALGGTTLVASSIVIVLRALDAADAQIRRMIDSGNETFNQLLRAGSYLAAFPTHEAARRVVDELMELRRGVSRKVVDLAGRVAGLEVELRDQQTETAVVREELAKSLDAERDHEEALSGIYDEAVRATSLMDKDGFAPYTPRGVVAVLIDKLLNATQRLAAAEKRANGAEELLSNIREVELRARNAEAEAERRGRGWDTAVVEKNRIENALHEELRYVREDRDKLLRQRADREVRPVELRARNGFTRILYVQGDPDSVFVSPDPQPLEINPGPLRPNFIPREFVRRTWLWLDAGGSGLPVYEER